MCMQCKICYIDISHCYGLPLAIKGWIIPQWNRPWTLEELISKPSLYACTLLWQCEVYSIVFFCFDPLPRISGYNRQSLVVPSLFINSGVF
jgi:hypothetical protein